MSLKSSQGSLNMEIIAKSNLSSVHKPNVSNNSNNEKVRLYVFRKIKSLEQYENKLYSKDLPKKLISILFFF